MPLKLTKKAPTAPTAEITKEVKEKGQTLSEDVKTETPKLEGVAQKKTTEAPWCHVGFEASYTHNLGNYQSARIGISLVIPCPHDEIDEVFEVGKAWVDERLEKAVEELKGGE